MSAKLICNLLISNPNLFQGRVVYDFCLNVMKMTLEETKQACCELIFFFTPQQIGAPPNVMHRMAAHLYLSCPSKLDEIFHACEQAGSSYDDSRTKALSYAISDSFARGDLQSLNTLCAQLESGGNVKMMRKRVVSEIEAWLFEKPRSIAFAGRGQLLIKRLKGRALLSEAGMTAFAYASMRGGSMSTVKLAEENGAVCELQQSLAAWMYSGDCSQVALLLKEMPGCSVRELMGEHYRDSVIHAAERGKVSALGMLLDAEIQQEDLMYAVEAAVRCNRLRALTFLQNLAKKRCWNSVLFAMNTLMLLYNHDDSQFERHAVAGVEGGVYLGLGELLRLNQIKGSDFGVQAWHRVFTTNPVQFTWGDGTVLSNCFQELLFSFCRQESLGPIRQLLHVFPVSIEVVGRIIPLLPFTSFSSLLILETFFSSSGSDFDFISVDSASANRVAYAAFAHNVPYGVQRLVPSVSKEVLLERCMHSISTRCVANLDIMRCMAPTIVQEALATVPNEELFSHQDLFSDWVLRFCK